MSPDSRLGGRPLSAWGRVLVLLGLVYAGLAGCGPAGEADRETLALRVEYAGCRTILRGPVCVLPEDRALRLWIQAPPSAQLELTAGGRQLANAGAPVQGGLRFELEIPQAASALTVRASADGTEARWTLELTERSDWLRHLDEATEADELEERDRLLEEAAELPSHPERGPALGRLARLTLRLGDAARAQELLEGAISACRETEMRFGEIDHTTLLVYLLIREHRFSDARALLDALSQGEGDPVEAVYLLAYYRGLLADEVGDFRSALRDLKEAAEQAERLSLGPQRRWAEQLRSDSLQRLGRSREAAALWSRLEQEGRREDAPCDRATLVNNYGWSLLLALEAGELAADPTPLLIEALAIWSDPAEDCPLAEESRVDALMNLGLAHLHGGRLEEARACLDSLPVSRESATVSQLLWWLEIDGRLALARGQADESLELYTEMARRAAKVFSQGARWRSAVGRARSLAALGQRSAALAALAEAEALLDEESLRVPFSEGRDTFLAQRENATRLYLQLLLDDDRAAEAFAVARRARSRVLRGLRQGDRLASLGKADQESWDRVIAEYRGLRDALEEEIATDWHLPADQLRRARERRAKEQQQLRRSLDRALAILDVKQPGSQPLPAPRPGEVVLGYHPLPRGWVGFAATADAVVARLLAAPDDVLSLPEELSARLLTPFVDAIEGAKRVRVLPYGVLRVVDFHALPFAGDVLVAARPVAYGLDLPPAASVPDGERPLQALLVADPNGNLPAARDEADAVRRALDAQPGKWNVEVLEGSQARGDALRRALPRAALFHYAGHAAFAGRGGWESALPLAGGSRLTLGDILAIRSAPRWVVLSGCETGLSAREAPLESLGLAQAFVAVGAGAVIAAVRPVGDRAAAALVRELYPEDEAAPDFTLALRRVQLALRQKDPQADWASFRVIEP